MKILHIESSRLTPDVYADPVKAELIISGKILEPHALGFFNPIIEWFKHYLLEYSKPIKVILDITYLSTSASLCILEFLNLARNNQNANPKTFFYWHYPSLDEDLFELGEDFQSIAKVPFELVER